VLKLRYCNLQGIPYQAFGDTSPVRNVHVDNNPLEIVTPEQLAVLSGLEMLDMSDCQISQIFPEAFAALPRLRSLHLENNFLRKLEHETFSNLKHLTMLNLQRNQVGSVQELTFQDLQRLEILKLNTNSLQHIPENVFKGLNKLQSVSIFNNQLQNIGTAFAELPELINVSLDSNFIQILDKDAFRGSQNLVTIDFQYNQIKHIHPDTFNELSKLEILNLQGNPLTTESAMALPFCAKFDYGPLISQIDPETLHSYVIQYSENKAFISQVLYSRKLLEKTWAFLRLIGYHH
jgi:Leucine-rich repeat (LRR) protein